MSPLRFLTAGESHGPSLVAILEGMPAGLELSAGDIAPDLARRQGLGPAGRPYLGASARMKVERDTAVILSGVMAGKTIGAPIAIQIENRDHAQWKGRPVEPMTTPRPGHADLAGAIKYGFDDLRPSLERASARETAARVAVGAVARKFLAVLGVHVGSYVSEIGGVTAEVADMPPAERVRLAAESELACPAAAAAMHSRIHQAMEAGDTLGGVFEVVAWGVPPGLGSYVHGDRRLSARLAAALFSIPAIKGVEIGPAFANARLPGSQVHDEIMLNDDGSLGRSANRAGGLEGGITTGEPIVLRAAMKPIATTLAPLASVDLAAGAGARTRYERSDFCAVPRAAVVGEAVVCLVLADALLEKVGGDSLTEILPRFAQLRRARLEDFAMRNQPQVFWP